MLEMKKCMLLLLASVYAIAYTNAQNDDAARQKAVKDMMKVEEAEGWTSAGAFGFDLGQMMILNPYVGQGQDRLGVGGAMGYILKYKKGLLSWTNDFNVNLSVQRFGSGVVAVGSDQRQPFEKSIDLLTLGSNLAYKMSETSPWSYSTDLMVLTQLLSSYQGNNGKYYITPVSAFQTQLRSKFLSPGEFIFGVGMKYEKSSNFQIYLSPVTGKFFYVADREIAALKTDDGQNVWGFEDGQQSRFDLGTNVKVNYVTKLMDRVGYTTSLSLFSNYLRNPERVDVIWLNTFGVEVVKNLSLQLKVDLFYDYDKINQLTDANAVGGVSGYGRTVNVIQQFLLTYHLTF